MSYYVTAYLSDYEIFFTLVFKDKDDYIKLFLEECFFTNLDVVSKGTIHSNYSTEEDSSEDESDNAFPY